jgi:hypothetical protein
MTALRNDFEEIAKNDGRRNGLAVREDVEIALRPPPASPRPSRAW